MTDKTPPLPPLPEPYFGMARRDGGIDHAGPWFTEAQIREYGAACRSSGVPADAMPNPIAHIHSNDEVCWDRARPTMWPLDVYTERDIRDLQYAVERAKDNARQERTLHLNFKLDLHRVLNGEETICDFEEIEAVRAALAAPPAAPGSVKMPTTADEAAAMCLIGERWLRDNAPERLCAAPPAAGPRWKLVPVEPTQEMLAASWADAHPRFIFTDHEWHIARAYRAMLDAAQPAAVPEPQPVAPIDMVLHCPACGMQHIDAPDERTPDWKNEPHRSHLCHGCGHIWRPADVPTNGVAVTKTKGKADSPLVAHPASAQPEQRRLSDEDCARLRELLRADRSFAISTLQSAGILTSDGKLSERFGGDTSTDKSAAPAPFIAWANDEGYDTAHAYDTDRSRWVFFNPMTADLWRAWEASRRAAPAADALVALRTAGAQLASVAFNWAQRPGYTLTAADCAMLDKLRRRWDAARAAIASPPADARDADARDAARYRWLRDNADSDWAICEWSSDHYDGVGYYRDSRAAPSVDAAIDAAMSAAPSSAGGEA